MSGFIIAWNVVFYSLSVVGLYALVSWAASRHKPPKK